MMYFIHNILTPERVFLVSTQHLALNLTKTNVGFLNLAIHVRYSSITFSLLIIKQTQLNVYTSN
jgi:hypothetical protein